MATIRSKRFHLLACGSLFLLFVTSIAFSKNTLAQEDSKPTYEIALQAAIDILKQAKPEGSDHWFMTVVGEFEYSENNKINNDIDLVLKHGEYGELYSVLHALQLTVTRKKGWPMFITFHPYQHSNTALGVVQAVLSKDNDLLIEKLKTIDASLNEPVYHDSVMGETPLKVAIQQGNLSGVKAILDAGAEPNATGLQKGVLPIVTAVVSKNDEALNLLVDAGVDVDSRLKFPFSKLPLLSYAASTKNDELLKKLLDLGADATKRDQFGWSPLMEAVHAQHWKSIELLLPVSDPTVMSTRAINEELVEKPLSRNYPLCNAIYIAEQIKSPLGEKILAALIENVGSVEGSLAVDSAQIQTHLTEVDRKAEAGQLKEALAELNLALKIVQRLQVTAESDAGLVNNVITLLLYKHELSLVLESSLSENERTLVKYLAELGSGTQKFHDMLDIFDAGLTRYPAEMITSWHRIYGKPKRKEWRYNLLVDWIESQQDVITRGRLYDVLDFFELN